MILFTVRKQCKTRKITGSELMRTDENFNAIENNARLQNQRVNTGAALQQGKTT